MFTLDIEKGYPVNNQAAFLIIHKFLTKQPPAPYPLNTTPSKEWV